MAHQVYQVSRDDCERHNLSHRLVDSFMIAWENRTLSFGYKLREEALAKIVAVNDERNFCLKIDTTVIKRKKPLANCVAVVYEGRQHFLTADEWEQLSKLIVRTHNWYEWESSLGRVHSGYYVQIPKSAEVWYKLFEGLIK